MIRESFKPGHSRILPHTVSAKKQNKITSTSMFQLIWLNVRISSLRRTGSKIPPTLSKPISVQRRCSLLQTYPLTSLQLLKVRKSHSNTSRAYWA